MNGIVAGIVGEEAINRNNSFGLEIGTVKLDSRFCYRVKR